MKDDIHKNVDFAVKKWKPAFEIKIQNFFIPDYRASHNTIIQMHDLIGLNTFWLKMRVPHD